MRRHAIASQKIVHFSANAAIAPNAFRELLISTLAAADAAVVTDDDDYYYCGC
jgi:hypothetical protein